MLFGLLLMRSTSQVTVAEEPIEGAGAGGQVEDTTSTWRVLSAPRSPTRAEREEHDVSHVPCRLWCRYLHGVEGRRRQRLIQPGDRDDDRPRMSADKGHVSGDSTPVLSAEVRRTGMVFAAAVSMKGGGDPNAARLLAKWMDGLGCQETPTRADREPSVCELVRCARELRAEGATNVGGVIPPGVSAAKG